jgi:cysteinyl-tRNA synthetase
MLSIYNTLTGKKEPFHSLQPKTVRMYVCGVTVYDYCHMGHARSALVFNVIRRYLEVSNYKVEFVKNFTDVDDKIIKRANERSVSCEALTTKYIEAYYQDMRKLGIRRATHEPKATEHMGEIIELVGRLIQKDLAYEVSGDVYFQVEKYQAYGRLSKRKLEDLQAGARVEVDERKRHPMDFALWKSSKPGEPSWESPWGAGRPGWHIECSAMAMRHLGETFDIHGGGMDLIFPHHENEIAQSCGATGKEFARYWVHNGFVQINQQKMSKSLGNFFTIREIFEKSQWPEAETGEMLRYFLLGTHYRSPLDFSDQSIEEAKNALNGFYDLLLKRLDEPRERVTGDKKLMEVIERCRVAFQSAMDDDFNTSVAIAELQRLKGDVNKLLSEGLSIEAQGIAKKEFRSLGEVLGLFKLEQWQFGHRPFRSALATDMPPPSRRSRIEEISQTDTPLALRAQLLADAEVQLKVDERNEARKQKNFKKADEIRQFLSSHGIVIEDKPDGTSRWKR